MVVFVVMVKLGFWQLSRGDEKQAIESALIARSHAQAVDISQWQENITQWQQAVADKDFDPHIGQKVRLVVSSLVAQKVADQKITEKNIPDLVYVDNQTWQGKVGYLVLQPVQMTSSESGHTFEQIGLVELGFVIMQQDRSQLPKVEPIKQQELTIEGRLYRKQANPMSDGLMVELFTNLNPNINPNISPNLNAIRIQNLQLSELSQSWGEDLFPYVIQPLNKGGMETKSEHLPHPWQPLSMTSKKHYGYAVQWFSMATALLILVGLFVYRARKKRVNKLRLQGRKL